MEISWMSIEIKVRNIKKAMKDLNNEMKYEINRQLPERKLKLIRALKEVTPIDTGEARDGWKMTPLGIDNNVEHISLLNGGTSKQAPARFVERTLLAHKDVTPSGIIV